jgi:hypothetical protein
MPNMEFRMHESGLHYYDPRTEEFTFVNTVSGNNEGFTQRQIKGAELARTLYATLSYPSWKDFKVHYRYYQTFFHIKFVQDPAHQGPLQLTLDGQLQQESVLRLINDQRDHLVRIVFGTTSEKEG